MIMIQTAFIIKRDLSYPRKQYIEVTRLPFGAPALEEKTCYLMLYLITYANTRNIVYFIFIVIESLSLASSILDTFTFSAETKQKQKKKIAKD